MHYDIVLSTGQKSLSGTDATVYVQLYGDKGTTEKFKFEDQSKELFEKGQTDTFRVRFLRLVVA